MRPVLKTTTINTPLGPMVAIVDEERLYFLEFHDQSSLERQIERLKNKINVDVVSGTTAITKALEKELNQYFEGTLQRFTVPLYLLGSPFQKQVWKELQKIPFGQTRSYADIAKAISKPTAFRAVANANGANQMAIVIPCHRVINTSGGLGGYAGGVSRKEWLLSHER